jgi:ATP-binding cassette subfamily F protein 3
MLTFKNVTYYVANRKLLDNISFHISSCQHVGVIGRNGTGKSTLFKIIQDPDNIDKGSIAFAKNLKILSIEQHFLENNISPMEYLLSKDKERLELLSRLEALSQITSNTNELTTIYDRLLQIDAYTAEARAAKILDGLGFSTFDQKKPLYTFSGGFKMRVALAAVLFLEPDLLLLDEPTNHLDFEASKWLQSFLKKYPKSFLLISHEKEFLNNVVDYILHLKETQVTTYKGNFDAFLVRYEQQQQSTQSYNKTLEKRKVDMLEFVNRNRANASRARQAQSRLKIISKMKLMPIEKNDPSITFSFQNSELLLSPIISFNKVKLGYKKNVILTNLNGTLVSTDRIALVGANGNGKSTIAKFLAGELPPLMGSFTISNKLRIAYYKQDAIEHLDLQETPLTLLQKKAPLQTVQQIKDHLHNFGFFYEKFTQLIGTLSGGEKARLLFCSLSIIKPHLLILDEPTNHLDIEMRESLIQAINKFNGTILVISHDKYFLNYVADQIWVVKNGKILTFAGTLDEYERSL